MGGRPDGVGASCSASEIEVEGMVAVVVGVVRRDCASAITPSARWSEPCRIDVLDWSVELSEFREAISPCRVLTATWRECDWERRDWAADSDCETLERSVSDRVLETACSSASFSGLGGMGGAGPDGANDGSSSSNGDVRRSCVGAGLGGAGAGACVGAGTGCAGGGACENWR